MRNRTKMDMWVTRTSLGFHTLQRSMCIHEGLRWGDCAWKDMFCSGFFLAISLFCLVFLFCFCFVRVVLLHQLSCWYCSSSLHFVASTCALCQCWVVVFACGGCCMLCVYMCMMSEALSFVSLLKSCLWPSLFAWMERDCIALMLWTNSCAEFDTIFFMSYCFPFSVLLCCI